MRAGLRLPRPPDQSHISQGDFSEIAIAKVLPSSSAAPQISMKQESGNVYDLFVVDESANASRFDLSASEPMNLMEDASQQVLSAHGEASNNLPSFGDEDESSMLDIDQDFEDEEVHLDLLLDFEQSHNVRASFSGQKPPEDGLRPLFPQDQGPPAQTMWRDHQDGPSFTRFSGIA
jgi:hypothetical protein